MSTHQVQGIARDIFATKLNFPFPRIYYMDVTREMRVTRRNKHPKKIAEYDDFFADDIRITWNECERDFARHEMAKRAGVKLACCKDPIFGHNCNPERWAEQVAKHREESRASALRTVEAWADKDPERAAKVVAEIMQPDYY